RQYYMLIKAVCFILSLIVFLLIVYIKDWSAMVILLGVCLLMVFIVLFPDRYLMMRKRKNALAIANDLPLLVDAMIVCMTTGMTIEMTISYLDKVIEQISPPLKLLLIQIKRNMLVQGISESIELAREVFPSDDMDVFSMTLVQSLIFGSSIVPKLTRLSEDIRVNAMLRTEEKINKLSAKMSAPLILFIMIPVVVVIVAPSIMRIME
ncbi:type II secretion system F family protein, partial [Vibrio mediterranei]|uniref:type II secretion system F family protein n=1 Tax=Vibrio mediterranei TaxID=689 RepID=UPI001EFDEBFB